MTYSLPIEAVLEINLFSKLFCKYSNEASKFICVHFIVIITDTRDYLKRGCTLCIFDRGYSITHFVVS